MPSSLVTDWKRIAQSGPTVDGRVIEPEWLTDMAETYDPKVYKAKIWLDHDRWSSYGGVEALKTEKDGDLLRLFAKISPNRSLLQMNQVWEEYLHFSIEVTEDFAKTGKTYLTGLAMTDSPASLGTDELRFSSRTGRTFTTRYPGELVPDLREEELENFGRNFFKSLFKIVRSNPEKTDEDYDMKPEEFTALKEDVSKTQEAVSGLNSKLDQFMEKFSEKDGSEEKPPEKPEPETETEENKDFSVLKNEVTGIKDSISALSNKFGTVLERLEKANPGTVFQESHTPAGDDLLL